MSVTMPGDRRAANRAVAVSAIGLGATGLIELLLAVLTGSVGLLGDAIHNLSDVSTSAVVFLGFRLSRRPASERYPYGLEWAEDLAGIGIAAVIWASAAFAGYESIRKLIGHGPTTHVGAGIAGAVIGIVGNPAVARYKLVVGRRIDSAHARRRCAHPTTTARRSDPTPRQKRASLAHDRGVGFPGRWA
jgi:cation diffusion facilitator family transporter